MIVITGAAGFIGSALAGALNAAGFRDLVLVDDFSRVEKAANHEKKHCLKRIHRDAFFEWLDQNGRQTDFVFHLGARTDTTEQSRDIFDRLNFNYSLKVWELCTKHQIPLVYASSAATYGNGEHGFKDDHDIIPHLVPLNPYGDSKNEFDKVVINKLPQESPFFWAGLKFFNVYGPNEYHKGRMASVIFHAYRQIMESGQMKLFRSHRSDFADGGQMRDFVYVKDVVSVCQFLMHHRKNSGIYNLGSGNARSFYDLAVNTFRAAGVRENISYIDTPADIRDKYQYFTEADMTKLKNIGYKQPFHTLEEGIEDYVVNHLANSCAIF